MAKKPTQAEQLRNLQERMAEMEKRENQRYDFQLAKRVKSLEDDLPPEFTERLRRESDERHAYLLRWTSENLPAPPTPSALPTWLAVVALASVVVVSALGYRAWRVFESQQIFPFGMIGSDAKGKLFVWSPQNKWEAYNAKRVAGDTLTISGDSKNCIDGDPSKPKVAPDAAICGTGNVPSVQFFHTPADYATGTIIADTGTIVAKHTLRLELAANCWVRVTEQTPAAKVLAEGQQTAESVLNYSFDEQATIEVRAGCPGAIEYRVDGAIEHPVNRSGKPKDSEVVDLLL